MCRTRAGKRPPKLSLRSTTHDLGMTSTNKCTKTDLEETMEAPRTAFLILCSVALSMP